MNNQDCVFHLLNKAARASARYWQKSVDDLELTAIQAKVLAFMTDMDQPTSQQLSSHAAVDAATLTGVIDRLIKLGLAKRLPDAHDRRVNKIDLTEQGKTVSASIRSRQQPSNDAFLAGLTDQEQQQLRRLLKKITETDSK